MQYDEIKKHLIMLIGVPGSGKSTYIEKLKFQNPNRDYVVLSTDNILVEWGAEKGWDYNQAFKNIPFKNVDSEFKRRYAEALENKKDIILDQTNLTIKSRGRKLSQVPNNYEKIGIVFEIDDEELNRRLKKRSAEMGKTIPDNIMKQMSESYQPPTNMEFDKIIKIN